MRGRAIFAVLLCGAFVAACGTKAPYGGPSGKNTTLTTTGSSNPGGPQVEVFTPANGSTLPAATVGQFYNTQITVTVAVPFISFNTPFTFPPGLTANITSSTSTFIIDGTPSTPGSYEISIGVAQGSVNYGITVQPAP
jgi:hypothetical protein